MQELETLLNSLIQRGWKPKNREVVSIKLDKEFTKSEGKTVFYCSCKDWFWFYADLRWIVSLESGLWQFVCENSFAKPNNHKICKNPKAYWCLGSLQWERWYWCDIAEYRLLESALLPEEELAKFLVDNIKL